MKIIYLGTPEFSLNPLIALYKKHEIVCVVSQIDKPQKRGKKIIFSPVKQFAIDNNIPVFQFVKIREDGVKILRDIEADVIVTCAYGQILNADILFMKKYGVLNIHASLLPKYRGASPVQWALINGEKNTGITILKSDIGIDDGLVLLQKTMDINSDDNATSLFKKLSELGAEAILEALEKIDNKSVEYKKQDELKATLCKMIKPGLAVVDFNKTSEEIVNLARGLSVWPKAQIKIDNIIIKVEKAKKIEENELLGILDNYFKKVNQVKDDKISCGVNNFNKIENKTLIDTNLCNKAENLTINNDNSCNNAENLTINNDNSCNNAENLTINDDNSCNNAENLTINDDNSCNNAENKTLIDINSINKIENGTVLVANSKYGLIIKTCDGAILLEQIIPANSKLMSSKSFCNGKKIEVGTRVE